MCNGLVERFNGTLKNMLHKVCQEKPKEWDRYLPALLFAYREVPQASTSFSPFELIYGRAIRGPLMVLREVWSNTELKEKQKSSYVYLLELRDKLEETCRIARESLAEAQASYKKYYDRRSRKRVLQVGDKALVLLPSDNNKLTMS
ncbi:uncharacterized protein LOC142814437 [Rhipicephalus microplus]|uniref:uncharacterized protein LOC142814437 n=1 Tax=Rhipicephalus microplus TaxID=6941 RepID=UPI003F6B5F8C